MNPAFRGSRFVAKNLHYRRSMSIQKNDQENKNRNSDPKEITPDDLVEPTNCCMSGCANCVWIQYAERLSDAMEGSDLNLQRTILEKVQDPNMKAFLTMELRCRKLMK